MKLTKKLATIMTLKTKFLPTLQHPLSKKKKKKRTNSKAPAQKDLQFTPEEFAGKDHPIIRAKNI